MKIQQSVNGENEATLTVLHASARSFNERNYVVQKSDWHDNTQITKKSNCWLNFVDSSFNASITPFPNCQKLQKHCQMSPYVAKNVRQQSSDC